MGLLISVPREAQKIRFYLKDKDITEDLEIRSVSMYIDHNTGITKVTMELFVERVDIEAGEARFDIIEWEDSEGLPDIITAKRKRARLQAS